MTRTFHAAATGRRVARGSRRGALAGGLLALVELGCAGPAAPGAAPRLGDPGAAAARAGVGPSSTVAERTGLAPTGATEAATGAPSTAPPLPPAPLCGDSTGPSDFERFMLARDPCPLACAA